MKDKQWLPTEGWVCYAEVSKKKKCWISLCDQSFKMVGTRSTVSFSISFNSENMSVWTLIKTWHSSVLLFYREKQLFEGTWFQRWKHYPFLSNRNENLWFYAFVTQALGDLGTLESGDNGEAHFSGSKEKLRVVDLIGRSVALYATEDRSDPGIAAAVIARSAGVGENYKKLCTCDGVTIWESS